MAALPDESHIAMDFTPYVPRLVIEWLAENPDREWREVDGTMAFVDISGFTAMSEKLATQGKAGAEQVTEVMNTTFDALLRVAYDYGGGLLKFGGDALLVFFDDEGHERRAARAAFEMRKTLRSIGRPKTTAGTVTLKMHAGLNSGRFLFTLYIGQNGGAMIHALDLKTAKARCIDLPGTGDYGAATSWTLQLSKDQRTLWGISPGYGRAVAIDVAQRAVTSAFASANAAGSLVIAVVRMSTTSQTVSVTDSAGNVYRDAVAQAQTADGHQIHIFYAANVTGGPNTVTATFSSVNNRPWLAIYEYGGVRATDPLDQTAGAQGSSATASSGPTGATTTANELVFAATGLPASYAGAVSAGAGYVLQRQDTGGSRAATESGTAAVPGSYTATFALGAPTNWTAVVATFAPVP